MIPCLLISTHTNPALKKRKRDERNRWVEGRDGGAVRAVEVVVIAMVDYALASGTIAYVRLNLASMLSR